MLSVTVKWLLLASVLVFGCASPAAGPPTDRRTDQPPTRAQTTLRAVIRAEPAALAGTFLLPVNLATYSQRRLFNAGLALVDGNGAVRPYLAEGLPRLNSDSWRVLPDGRMETTYRLKPNLVWHDGQSLVAADFAFGWRVYTTPDFGLATTPPHGFMEDVQAPDDRTVLIRWRRPFPEAGALTAFTGSGAENEVFTPLPRHILAQPYEQERENFISHPYWSTEYLGLGPYRLERWEPGAFIEAVAFDGHVLGRPRIERVRLTWSADFNTTLAAILAGETDIPLDESLRVQQGLVLKREWSARNAGTVEYRPNLWRWIQLQHRPELVNPRALHDPRLREALAHTIDKQAINQGLFEGEGIMSDTIVPPTEDYYGTVDRALVKYGYDLRVAEQLLADAGFARGVDGTYASPTEGRLNLELRVISSPQNDAERSIIADAWRRFGFEVEEGGFTAAQARDGETLTRFRALSTTSGPLGANSMVNYTTGQIPRPENRWVGQNRGGWSNPEYDRIFEQYQTTFMREERIGHLAQAARILSEQLGVIPLYFNPGVLAYPATLRGVSVKAAEAEATWNIYEWELRQG